MLNQESALQPILLDPSRTVLGGFLNLLLLVNPCLSLWDYLTREIPLTTKSFPGTLEQLLDEIYPPVFNSRGSHF